MSSWDWGSVPEWIAALVTSAAFGVAARTYSKSRGDKHVAQARKVSVILGDLQRHSDGEWVDVTEGAVEPGVFGLQVDDDLGYKAISRCLQVHVTIYNNSDEDISGVFATLKLEHDDDEEMALPRLEYSFNALPPGRHGDFDFVWIDTWHKPDVDFEVPVIAHLSFTDSAGTHWRREGSNPVHEIRESPYVPGFGRSLIVATYVDEF